ncbi:sugar transferase [Romboutsia timonensis]|uniref:sugar transferase n=1 Tax=Romboutsia timonensis TaxID=1776391 RepID=UPI003991E677
MYIKVKRLIDLVVSISLLVMLSPIILAVYLLSKVFIGKEVIFTQTRIGLNNKEFKVIKFKTMTDECDDDGNLLPDKDRLIKYGLILRKLSLDELPQLINVIKGDMSLIGPRPLLVRYLPYYTEEERRRHSIRPGITGLAQVNGRNGLAWDDRLGLDVTYVDNMSFTLDIKILVATVLKVLKSDGVKEDVTKDMLDLDQERKFAYEEI